MKVLSLFDGMACGMLAMQIAGIEVERYVAYEIDKYAVQTSTHNFPMIEHRGDVFKADFTEFEGFDFLVGGSPCTYWSIAQKNNRETEASGLGWELFNQYVRALHEAKPRFFVYENNKSMSKAIRASIDEAFGFEAIGINSALVSAQNRQRLYWVGKRNEDGTYSKVDIEQPEDRGILLKDILESGTAWQDKSFAYTTRCQGATPHDTIGKHRHTMVAEPIRVGTMPQLNGVLKDNQATRIYSIEGKSVTQSAEGCGWGAKTGLYAVPTSYATVCEWDENGKPIKDISVADGKEYTAYEVCSFSHPHGWNEGIFTYEKFPNLTTGSSCRQQNVLIEPLTKENEHLLEKPQAFCNQKHEVKDGYITIKGKTYPIKLAPGFYIIRKLTVRECMRLQTVPEWYEFPVSDSQAYKMLGNGWTVEVIAHLLNGCMKEEA